MSSPKNDKGGIRKLMKRYDRRTSSSTQPPPLSPGSRTSPAEGAGAFRSAPPTPRSVGQGVMVVSSVGQSVVPTSPPLPSPMARAPSIATAETLFESPPSFWATHRLKIMASAETILKTVEKVCEVDPTGVGVAISGSLAEIIKAARTMIENNEELVDLVATIEKAQLVVIDHTCSGLGFGISNTVSPELHHRILEYTASLEALRASFEHRSSRSAASLIKRMLDAERTANDLRGIWERLHAENIRFVLQTVVSMESKVDSLIVTAQTAEQHSRRTSDQCLLKCLRPIEAAYHDAYDATGVSRPCMEGTRAQLLKDIKEWILDTSSSQSQVYWLNGLAGTGKTSVARSIAKWGQRQGLLAATFFFSRDAIDRRDPAAVIPTVVHQMAEHDDALKRRICGSLVSRQDIRGKTIAEQSKTLLRCLEDVNIGTPTPMLLVFDALDERVPHHDDPIGRVIQHVCSLPFSTKVFVTSRDNPMTEAMLSRNNAIRLRIHHIDEQVVRSDIQYYFERSLDRLADERNLTKPFPASHADIDALVQTSGTLFVHAATIFRWIADNRWSPESRMKEILLRDPDDSADQHEALDSMYLRILQNAAEAAKGHQHVKMLTTIVSVLVYAQEPISASVLTDIISFHATRPASIERVRGHLQQLSAVLVSEGDAPIRFFHPSFPEFFQNPERCEDQRFYMSAAATHALLASYSVAIMNTELLNNISSLEDPSIANRNIHDLPARLEQTTTPGLRYACTHWPHHLREAGELDKPSLPSLTSFCTLHLLNWLEVLSLLDKWTMISKGLRPLVKHLSQMTGYRDVVDLLKNVLQTFIEYHAPLRTHALHVYHTALATMPVCKLWSAATGKNHDVPLLISPRPEGYQGVQVLEGHLGLVMCVAFSPDGALIVSCSNDKTVRLWDTQSGATLHQFKGREDWRCVAFAPDGAHIIAGSDDKDVYMWDAQSGALVRRFTGHQHWVRSVAFSPDGAFIVSGSHDKTLRVWDTQSGGMVRLVTGQEKSIRSVAFSPNSAYIVSGSDDMSVQVWDARSGAVVHRLAGHEDSVRSVMFSPDGTLIISGSDDKTIRIWNARTGASVLRLEGHEEFVASVAFSPDGARIASGSYDKTVRLWDAQSGTMLHSLAGHGKWVRSVAFSPDSAYIVSGSDDKTVRVWDLESDAADPRLEGHESWVQSIAFSPDGTRIVSGSDDHSVRVWDAQSGAHIHTLEGHEDSVRSVAFSPDGTRIVSGSYDHSTRVWDAQSGAAIHRFNRGSSVTSVAFSPDGTHIIVDTYDKDVYVWHAQSGAAVHSVLDGIPEDQEHRVFASSPTEDDLGRTVSEDVSFELDVETGWINRRKPGDVWRQVCWLPRERRVMGTLTSHGQKVAIGSQTGTVTILDFANVR